MLEVKDVRTLPDSSSIIDAMGISRFQVGFEPPSQRQLQHSGH